MASVRANEETEILTRREQKKPISASQKLTTDDTDRRDFNRWVRWIAFRVWCG